MGLSDDLETIAVGCVAITARSLVEASAAELTFTQWRALVVIAAWPGIRVGSLAVLMGARQPATSRLVSRMVRRGLVSAQTDSVDRRATTLTLAPAGRDVHERVTSARRRHLTALAEELVDDLPEPSIAALAQALAVPGEEESGYEGRAGV